MADQLKLRGGPTAQAEVFVGAEREITVDTGLKALRIHDGVTPGGHLIELKADAIAARTAAAASNNTARTLLQSAIDNAIAERVSGDASTLASANAYTDTAISNLIGGSPDLLNTLNEIAQAINDDENFFSTLNTSITTVQADVDANEAAANTAIAAVQADVDSNEAAALAGRNALSARIDVLELDPTTATAVNNGDVNSVSIANSYTDTEVAAGDAAVTSALTALITTETSARSAADTALDARIDVVQADVDQNEADSDAAIAAEEARALAAEAAITAARVAEEAARNELNLHAGLAFGQLYVSDLIVA